MLVLFYQAVQFTVKTVMELYILLMCLQILLYWAHISHANPIFLSIERVTKPVLQPVYNIVPAFNGIDLAAIVLLSILSTLKIGLMFWWQLHYIPALTGLVMLAFADILKQFVDIFFFMIIAFNFINWVGAFITPAIIEIVMKVNAPFLHLTQRLLPPIAGLNFSPMLIMIGLRLTTFFIVTPLMQVSIKLAKLV